MKPMEIPYNFDKALIDALVTIDPTGNSYHSIYCCPHKDDYHAAKRNHINSTGLDMQQSNDMDKATYIEHIMYIKKKFPNKLMLLLQQNNVLIDEDKLRFYIGLGFTKFCVGSYEQAKAIKNISKAYEVIGSITMKATMEDFKKKEYKEVFDGFVLFFPFNRNFDLIKQLPTEDFNFTLLVNCDCNIKCSGTGHWFASREAEITKSFNCPNRFFASRGYPDWEEIIRIRPMDMSLFDPYISYYKLQGREQTTRSIIFNICLYAADYSIYPGITYSEDIYRKVDRSDEAN